MSFLYPHKVSIRRPVAATPTEGVRQYSAARGAASETEIHTDVQCSVQEFVNGPRSPVGLPADAKVQSQWRIMIPKRAGIPLEFDVLRANDVCVNPAGGRYHVWAAIPTSLGWELDAVMLEV